MNKVDLFKEAASAMGVSVPKELMRSNKLIDGVVWDGKDPKKYADGFQDQGPIPGPHVCATRPIRVFRFCH